MIRLAIAAVVALSVVRAASLSAAPNIVGDTVPVSYEVNGLRVIHLQRASATDVIAVQLYLLGGARQVTAANAGIEPFMLMASAYGSQKYPGEKARRALALTGSRIYVSAESDWTSFSLSGVKQDFDSAWAVFADRLVHPTLDSTSMAIVRKRMLASIGRRVASPEDHLDFLADSLAFQGHPYAVNPSGNEKSIAALTADDIRRYARDQLVTSRMLLVVVGDVSRAQVEQAIGRTLGTLPKGSYTWSLPPSWKASKSAVLSANRATQTNYILGYMSGPPRSSPQYPAFERAMGVLSGWVGFVVREQSGLSYAAYVRMLDRGAPGAAIYMSTTKPDTAMKLVNRILESYEGEVMVPRTTLRKSARSFEVAYRYSTETAATYAEVLARAQLYDGDFLAASRQAQVMSSLAFHDLRRMIKEYARNIQYAFVGDTTQVPLKEFTKR